MSPRVSRLLAWGGAAICLTLALRAAHHRVEAQDRTPPAAIVRPVKAPRIDRPVPAAPKAPEPEIVQQAPRLVLAATWYVDVSTYTPDADGGKATRPTAAATLRSRDRRYPREFTTLEYIIDNQIPIVAVPWKYRHLHEALVERPDGSAFHRYRLRFPWYDAPGVLRIPCDRVPYRGRDGRPLPQRDRFDMFMHMPGRQAMKHGVPLMPVEIYEVVD